MLEVQPVDEHRLKIQNLHRKFNLALLFYLHTLNGSKFRKLLVLEGLNIAQYPSDHTTLHITRSYYRGSQASLIEPERDMTVSGTKHAASKLRLAKCEASCEMRRHAN